MGLGLATAKKLASLQAYITLVDYNENALNWIMLKQIRQNV